MASSLTPDELFLTTPGSNISVISILNVLGFHAVVPQRYAHQEVDISTVTTERRDDIFIFIHERMIDGHWRATEYKVQSRFPAVINLAIHKEGQQNVAFRKGHAQEAPAEQNYIALLLQTQLEGP